MRNLATILACLLIPSLLFSQEKRLALVIGNSDYDAGSYLSNPVNDAEDIAAALSKLDFDVSIHLDLSQSEMKKVIDDFGKKLENADIGLFFYAGHGIQARGRNYLVPTDAQLKTENDVEYNCVDAGRILAKLEDAGTGTNIIILDACRNNPFERSWTRTSNGNGLAFMNAPSGSLIAYSTAPGKTASDGYSRNSPYTEGLLEFMDTPNLKIEDLFKLVRVEVMNKTKGEQEPWEATSLRGDFFFKADKNQAKISLNELLPAYDKEVSEPVDYETRRESMAAGIRSVAIMPFTNYTGDNSKAYLASGMQDALITELGKLGSLRVTSQTSTLRYADFGKSIKEIASELNVEGVIETSLIGLGDSLRIQLKLYGSEPEEEMLWTNVFTSEMNDILNLYNRVIKNIAEEIQLTLSPDQINELEVSRKIDAEAYLNYLQGRKYWSSVSKESLFKARDYFNEGIKVVDDWAPLYAGLVQAWGGIAQMGFESQEIAGQKIMENMTKALELDPEFPDLHFIQGLMNIWQLWDWSNGEKCLLKAISINPSDALARIYYAHLLAILNRGEEALVQADLAVELDPFNPLVLGLHSAVYMFLEQFDDAVIQAERALSLTNNEDLFAHGIRELAALACGEYDKAWESFRYYSLNILGYTEKELTSLDEEINKKGYPVVYNQILAQIEERNESDMIMTIAELACRYSWLENGEKSLELYQKAFELHDPNLPYIATWWTNIDVLIDNPGFIEIVDKMNLSLADR